MDLSVPGTLREGSGLKSRLHRIRCSRCHHRRSYWLQLAPWVAWQQETAWPT